MLAQARPGRDAGEGTRPELVPAELQALIRLGVPASWHIGSLEAGARWKLASMTAEGSLKRHP
jgi:TetR/AcrR family tetracycline transcriptional repressor